MRVVRWLVESLNSVGNAMIMVLMLMVTADVIARSVFNKSFLAAFELSGYMLGALVWFSFAHTFATKGHVHVDMFVNRFPARTRLFLETMASLLSLGLFALIVWRSVLSAQVTISLGEVTETLRLPIGLVKLMVPIGAFVVCLELLVETAGGFVRLARGEVDKTQSEGVDLG